MYKGMPEMMELADERQQKSKQNKNEYSDRSIMRVLLSVHIVNYDRPTNQPTDQTTTTQVIKQLSMFVVLLKILF